MSRRLSVIALLGLVALLSACNVYEPFYQEGGSDDPLKLLADAKVALANGEAEKAFELLDRAIELAPDNPEIRYYHAVAVIRVNRIDFLTFFDALGEINGKSSAPNPKVVTALFSAEDGIPLFDISEEDLTRLYLAFLQVEADLTPVALGLIQGRYPLEDVPFADDVYLSNGISNLIVAMLSILDADTTDDRFTLDPRLQIQRVDGGYQVSAEDPNKTPAELDEEIDALINWQWQRFLSSRENFWRYYYLTQLGSLPTEVLPAPPARLPLRPNDSPAGIILKAVHEGILALYREKEDLN
jgi:hypothetical protein